jgi:hypothetical protein
MPRRPVAKETAADALRREILIAEALCRKEEDEISDAETLDSDSDYEPSSSDGDESYDSDFIDDSEAPSDPPIKNKWKTFDMKSLENPFYTGEEWQIFRPSIRVK